MVSCPLSAINQNKIIKGKGGGVLKNFFDI
jgi:hypothetical protein